MEVQVVHSEEEKREGAIVPMTGNQRIGAICSLEKTAGIMYRERRQPEWLETYQFYRDRVTINRLTQRQSVNIPLMKYTVKTLLKDIDDPPMLYFYNRSNNSQKEVFYNEYYKYCMKEDKLKTKDIVDKKQVLLFGRSFKKLNIVNGRFSFEIVDPQDMIVSRFGDQTNLDTKSFVCQEHIFRNLSELSENPLYDDDAILELQEYYATAQGLIKAEENRRSLEDKNARMELMGMTDLQNPSLGETVVELNECYIKVWDETLKRRVIWLVVMSDGNTLLACQPLHELIGKTVDDFWMDHFPFTTWGEDPEVTDFWMDGVCDVIRTINKVLNSWISQLVENRTLVNWGMQYYNSKTPGFIPQTFDPVPFGWYPVPGNPNEIIKRVDIEKLGESINEIKLLLDIADKATAASSTSQGGVEQQKVTLGEIQLALANAKERVKGMAPLYTDSWEEFGVKYTKMMEAAGDEYIDAVKLYKKGKETKRMYSKVVSYNDMKDYEGYETEVTDMSQVVGETSDTIQKLTFSKSLMPNNKPLNDILKQKSIEWAGLTSTQIKDVMDYEKQLEKAPTPPLLTAPGGNPTEGAGMGGGGVAPTQPVLTA